MKYAAELSSALKLKAEMGGNLAEKQPLISDLKLIAT